MGHVLRVGVGGLVLLLPSVLESGLVVVCTGLWSLYCSWWSFFFICL